MVRPAEASFLHARFGQQTCGELATGKMVATCCLLDTLTVSTVDVIDHDLGPANCMVYRHDGSDYIVAAYRETDQLALYKVVE